MGRNSFVRHGRGLAATLSCLTLVLVPLLGGLTPGQDYIAGAADTALIEPADTLKLTGLQRQFAAVTKQVAPVVVAISASTERIGDDALRSENLNPNRLERMLGRSTRTVGTGLFIDSEGFILTNEHVIGEAEQLWVTTDDRRVYPAIVIGSDPRADLAVLKIPASEMPVARFSMEPVERGQWTIALGNPYGLAIEGQLAMSVGVVSAVERSLPKLSARENRLYANLIQTTAQINPGSSGGPLFDVNGEVIGITTAVILPQKTTNGIGFAIPVSDELLDTIEHLKNGREVTYGYIGVTVTEPTPRELRGAGLRSGDGAARIDMVEPNSPASTGGLKNEDMVIAIEGVAVRHADHFVRLVGRMPVNRPGRITVSRGGKVIDLHVTPRPRNLPAVAVSQSNQRFRWNGMTLGHVPSNWAAAPGEEAITGLYVLGVDDPERCSELGIKQGMIIRAVAGQVVRSIADLQQIIDATPPEQISLETAEPTTVAAVQSP